MAAVDVIWDTFSAIGTILMWGWPFIILLILFGLRLKWKPWPVDVIIIEKRGSNLIKTNDRAGKYVDAYTGMTGYRLLKCKDTIPIVNYDWVLHNVVINTNIFERLVNLLRGNIGTIFLFRYGSKQYKPINIKEDINKKIEFAEIKDKKGNPVFIRIYQQFDPRDKLGALNFDVIDWDNMNFMVQEQRASFDRRRKKGEFMKQILIPLGAMVVAALVCIMMIKFSYDWAVGMVAAGKGTTPKPESTTPNIPIISDLVPGE